MLRLDQEYLKYLILKKEVCETTLTLFEKCQLYVFLLIFALLNSELSQFLIITIPNIFLESKIS